VLAAESPDLHYGFGGALVEFDDLELYENSARLTVSFATWYAISPDIPRCSGNASVPVSGSGTSRSRRLSARTRSGSRRESTAPAATVPFASGDW